MLPGLHGKIALVASDPAIAGAGWVTMPGGSYARDPSSPSVSQAHDLALNRWLPVPREQISPDGTKYAFVEHYSTGCWIRVVWSRGDSFRVNVPDIYRTCEVGWVILWTANNGMYIEPWPASAPGLWWAPFFGQPREITSTGYWTASDGRFAYGFIAPTNDSRSTRIILQLDLADGSTTPVFWAPGKLTDVVGVDRDGNAVVVTRSNSGRPPWVADVWLAGPTGRLEIYREPDGYVNSVVADTIGTWFTSHEGVFLYSASGGLEHASPVRGYLASAFRPSSR